LVTITVLFFSCCVAMEEFLHSYLGAKCFTELITNKNVFYEPCVKLLISKALGLLIIAGSLIIKVPQILKIVNAKSAKGISLTSVLLELVCLLFTMSFSYRKQFPFGTYGETVFVTIQNFVIIFLIYYYGNGDKKPEGISPSFFGILAIYAVVLYSFLANPGDLVQVSLIESLQSLNIPIMISSRVPQIISNFTTKSTGQLAIATWLLTFAGALARVFTTLQEAYSLILLASYLIGASLSSTICFQIFYYAPTTQPPKKQRID